MVAHLLNIDAGLAETVAKGLRLKEMPKRPPPPRSRPGPTSSRSDEAEHHQLNGPKTFAGRKVGALVTDGVDAGVLAALGEGPQGRGGDASS